MPETPKTVRWWVGTDLEPEKRLQVEVSAEDAKKQPPHGVTTTFEVTDLLTNKQIKLRRADCGLGCQCALELVPDVDKAELLRLLKTAVSLQEQEWDAERDIELELSIDIKN